MRRDEGGSTNGRSYEGIRDREEYLYILQLPNVCALEN